MSHQQSNSPGRITALGLSLTLLSGCSVFTKNTRPVPGADRNLTCLVEYRPSSTNSSKHDLLLLVSAFPYQLEKVYMNPVDGFFHAIFAPGRHLRKPVRVEGATCEPPVWGKGHRIPQLARPQRGMLCKRNELERVVIEAITKFGHCRVEIPAGESAPMCEEWGGELGMEIDGILDEPCRRPRRGNP